MNLFPVDIDLWGTKIPTNILTESEVKYLKSLPLNMPTVEWVWRELDRIWDGYCLNNRLPLSGQMIGEFYSHPAWLMNGIFTSVDPVSVMHRDSLSTYIDKANCNLIADYGGGFGELAIKIVNESDKAHVQVVEPFPSKFGLYRLANQERIEVVQSLGKDEYDVVIAQDVLEHVEDPIGLAANLAESVKNNSLIIFANCFYPVIKCHLPATFHLRHTFNFIMKRYGLDYIERVPGAQHALVFRKSGKLNIKSARTAEKITRQFGSFLNLAGSSVSWLNSFLTS